MFGSGEQWLKFKTAIPVHLLYMNAYVDDAGKLVIREDIYGYDARVRAALRGDSLPAVAEKSQVVKPEHTAGARSRGGRRIVQDQQQRGWFPFFFQ
jgi:L,D-transpeptidase YcbB